MDSESTPQPRRSDLLRAHLVATAATQSHNPISTQRRWMSRKPAALALGVFALAGALTGGAVSATAISAARPETVTLSVNELKAGLEGNNALLFGAPVLVSGQGDTVIELGDRPEGASELAFVFHCIDPGTYAWSRDGEAPATTVCTEENSPGSGVSDLLGVDGDGEHTLEVKGDGTGRYAVWAQWSKRPADPPQSTAQVSELADAQVTRDEYERGFQRFVDCMADAGHEVMSINKTEQRIDYVITGESVTDGTDARCYRTEYEALDNIWQTAHADNSETERILRQCFADAGVPFDGTFDEVWLRFQGAEMPLTLEDCFPL
jgi:hypothetical protein